MGGLGSSLIFYHDYSFGEEGSIKGDIFALFAMFADIVLVVSQIRYAKYLKDGQSIFINIYSYSAIALLLLPFLLMHFDVFSSLSWSQILFSMGAGVLVAIGKILNFEAFRRMDGFIAFLMFNISILITFVVEAFILKEIFVTYLLVVGGALVIASSGLAEYINTKCEKRELSIVDAKK